MDTWNGMLVPIELGHSSWRRCQCESAFRSRNYETNIPLLPPRSHYDAHLALFPLVPHYFFSFVWLSTWLSFAIGRKGLWVFLSSHLLVLSWDRSIEIHIWLGGKNGISHKVAEEFSHTLHHWPLDASTFLTRVEDLGVKVLLVLTLEWHWTLLRFELDETLARMPMGQIYQRHPRAFLWGNLDGNRQRNICKSSFTWIKKHHSL